MNFTILIFVSYALRLPCLVINNTAYCNVIQQIREGPDFLNKLPPINDYFVCTMHIMRKLYAETSLSEGGSDSKV